MPFVIVLLAGVVFLGSNKFSSINQNTQMQTKLPSPQFVLSQIKDGGAALVDVRTDEEWGAGHASGATHFNVSRLQEGELPSISKDLDIYLYCRSGHRAGIAKNILEQNGFTKVINLGGLSAWQDAGGPVVK